MSSNGYDTDQIKATYRLADIAEKYGAKLTARHGKWLGRCPLPGHSDKKPSFAICTEANGDEFFKCLGCDRGGDVIGFVMEMEGTDFQGACQILTGLDRSTTAKAIPADPYADLQVCRPPRNDPPTFRPRELTPPVFNPKSGKSPRYQPEAVYTYTNSDGSPLGYVLRVLWEDGKKFCPSIMWVKRPGQHKGGMWAHFDMPRPRIYHLHDLFQRPETLPVIITEGEKCADAAAALLPDMVSITWCGGTSAVGKANWNPVAKYQRNVILWPDNDEPGRACMLGSWQHGIWKPGLIETLLAEGCTVQVVRPPANKPEGWDIADALEEGFTPDVAAKYLIGMAEPWSKKAVAEYAERIRPAPERPEPVVQLHPVEQPLPDESDTPELARAAAKIIDLKTRQPVSPGTPEDWLREVEPDAHGKPKKKSFQNYWLHIAYGPSLAGVFAWNAFANAPCVMKAPPWEKKEVAYPRPLNNFDLPALRAYLEQAFKLTPAAGEITPAILRAVKENQFNPVTDYFDALKWDGIGRVQGRGREPWLTDYMGADETEINTAYGMRWMISCVARAYQPGCKADCMLVLEGKQGIGKSSVFHALAQIDHFGRYFTDSLSDLASKDSKQLLAGKMIVEIPELAAYRSTKDVDRVKNFLSLLFDEYRPPYGTVPETFQRTCVFAGTVNPGGSGYLNDPTGERRFWPVAVKQIDVERVRRDRDQLWAEAVALYRDDIQHYLLPAEDGMSEKATRKRQARDPWHKLVISHVSGAKSTTIADVMGMDCLKLEKKDWTRANSERIGNILHSEGWQRTVELTPDGGSAEVYTKD